MRCPKCQGDLEPIVRSGQFVFNFCRACKIPYTEQGRAIFNSGQLVSHFRPLESVRGIIGKTHGSASAVARTALEVMLLQGMWDAYFAGVKDGVLLAYSQDVGEGEPVGDKDEPLSGAARDTR